MTISPDGNFALVSTYYNREGPWKNGSLWLAQTSDAKRIWGGELKADEQGFLPVVRGRTFSADSRLVAVAKHYLGVNERTTEIQERKQKIAKTASRNAMHLEGQRLDIEIRNSQDGKLLRVISFPDPPSEVPINSDRLTHAISLVFSPDGQTLAAVANHIAYAFSVSNGTLKATVIRPQTLKSESEFPLAAFSPNSKILAICRGDKIEIWGTKSFELAQTFFARARTLAFSPDGKWLASDEVLDNNVSEGRGLYVWEVGSLN